MEMIVVTTLQPKQIMSFFSTCPHLGRNTISIKARAPDLAQVFANDLRVACNRSTYVAGAGGVCLEWFNKYNRDGVILGYANAGEQVEIEVQNRADIEQEISLEFIWAPVLRLVASS